MKRLLLYFNPDSGQSLQVTLFFWRLQKPAVAVVTIAALAVLVTNVGPLIAPKSQEQRLAAKVEANVRPASYRQAGPWRVRDTYRQVGPWRVRSDEGF